MSEADRQESVVLCEGFHDRAFWAGLLTHLGCTDPGTKFGNTARLPIKDPWERPVQGGHFAYHSKSGKFIRVKPCGGKEFILREARARLAERSVRSLLRLVINVDTDVDSRQANPSATGMRIQDILAQVGALESSARLNQEGEIEIDGGATKVSLVRWETKDVLTPGLPVQQTLERLICSALVAAYPQRGPCVQTWLDTRHEPPDTDGKAFAWSYMAGWYAEHGCDDFYRRLWEDTTVVAELKSRLEAAGAWQILQALAT